MGWARLLKRVFEIDLEHCPQCGGAFRIIAAIVAPAVIVKILTRQGSAARAGAEAGAFSGGLIPEGMNGSATALRVLHGPPLRAWGQPSSKSGNSGLFRG